MDYTGYEYIIAESDHDGYADEFASFLYDNYPGMDVEIVKNQSGGTILLTPDGIEANQFDHDFTANDLWTDFCNNN